MIQIPFEVASIQGADVLFHDRSLEKRLEARMTPSKVVHSRDQGTCLVTNAVTTRTFASFLTCRESWSVG